MIPPFLVDYRARDGRTIAGDRDSGWLDPAFTQIVRVLKPDLCVSFYGWGEADRFVAAWKKVGLVPVSHLAFVKDYISFKGYTQMFSRSVLPEAGRPKPTHPIRDVLDREYTGNKFHPHEKPISAMTALITAFSKPGAIVLDPFAGSATTAIAALDCGRRFIMIEKMPRHYRVARSRLNFAKFAIGKPISPCSVLSAVRASSESNQTRSNPFARWSGKRVTVNAKDSIMASTLALLDRLKSDMPEIWNRAQIVGKWVWS